MGLANLKIPERTKSRIKSDVGQFLVEQILSSASASKSPVEGEDWPPLSDAYKRQKKAEGLGGKANLEAEGDLLDALGFDETKDGIEIGWTGKQAGKADGHNNLSGDSSIPTRRVLPDVGQEFIPRIQKEAERIISDAIGDEVSLEDSDFQAVTNRDELYSTLKDYFPDLSRAEIRVAITRSVGIARFLDDLGLFTLL